MTRVEQLRRNRFVLLLAEHNAELARREKMGQTRTYNATVINRKER